MKKGIELPSLWWTDIEGYENYQVSVNGDVKNVKTGRILRPQKDRGGYLRVNLYKNNKLKSYLVHRLVAQAFIPNPDNLPEVNHIDEDKTNNRVENLEWCTRQYNNNWGTRNERLSKTKTNGNLSKPVIAINPDTGEVVAEFPSAQEAGRKGYCTTCVVDCCNGKLKSSKGLIWCFKGTSDEEIDRCIAEYWLYGGVNSKSKSVVGINPDTGEVVVKFPSTCEAGRNGYSQQSVSECCRGKMKKHHGLIWKYKDDFDRKKDTGHYYEQS